MAYDEDMTEAERKRRKMLQTVLASEMNALQQRENQMYELYDYVYMEVSDEDIKEKIKFIRDQELGHIRLVTEMISIIGEHMTKEDY